jgi:transcriptional regulator with GAF, ATPase, and Fis domain
MAPRLLAIAGCLKGSAFPLSSAEVRIGRDLSNAIAVTDASASRVHSAVVEVEGCFLVRDLGSLNGTFVNGTTAKERRLKHGDEIRVGASLFLFLTDEPPGPREAEAPMGELRFGSTIQVRLEDALYTDPARLASALPPGEVARDVGLLLRAGRAAQSARSLEDLGRQLLIFTLEAIKPMRAAVLFFGLGPEDVAVSLARDASGTEKPARISQTVVAEATRGRAAILSNGAIGSFAKAPSLLRAHVHALMAAPLLAGDSVLGLLYADTSDPATPFLDHDLQLLIGLAEVGARAAANLRQLESVAADRRRLQEDAGLREELVGESASMSAMHQTIVKVAPTDTTVLILGESGTGKELTARAIHRTSRRAEGPLVVINCGALTESLLESELFGHEKGAFTGAIARKRGKIELGDTGTVFLDEVGEVPLSLQTKLLRFLQEREIERVGGTAPIKVDVRLIAATNRDLAAAVKEGTFRQDLYYRLNVVSLTLPPLRERAGDVRLLATHFLARHARRNNKSVLGITSEAWEYLLGHDWPGNVRELSNVIERAVVLGSDEWVRPEDLPESLIEREAGIAESGAGFHALVNAAKRKAVQEALAATGGVVTEAARRLELHPNYLHRLMRNLGLRT